jgi:hypothetical protein
MTNTCEYFLHVSHGLSQLLAKEPDATACRNQNSDGEQDSEPVNCGYFDERPHGEWWVSAKRCLDNTCYWGELSALLSYSFYCAVPHGGATAT